MLVWKSLSVGFASLAAVLIASATAGYAASPVPASVAHQCSLRYKAARDEGTLAGRKWPQFFSECRAGLEAGDAAVSRKENAAEPASYAAGKDGAGGKTLTPSQVAFRQRIHECSRQWHRDKAENRLQAGQKWPQYWSACNTRLKQQD